MNKIYVLNEFRKKENGGVSQADQRENHRFFSVFKSVNRSKKSNDTLTLSAAGARSQKSRCRTVLVKVGIAK